MNKSYISFRYVNGSVDKSMFEMDRIVQKFRFKVCTIYTIGESTMVCGELIEGEMPVMGKVKLPNDDTCKYIGQIYGKQKPFIQHEVFGIRLVGLYKNSIKEGDILTNVK